MLITLNITPKGITLTEQEVKKRCVNLIHWIENTNRYDNPKDIFGEEFTLPLKESNDEENGGLWNCDEWLINLNISKNSIDSLYYFLTDLLDQSQVGVMIEGSPYISPKMK